MNDSLRQYSSEFDRLDSLCGSELYINGFRLQLLGIHLMCCRPGWHAGKHNHSFFELHYIDQGSCQTTINEVSRGIQAKNFYLIQPGSVHAHLSREGHTGFSLRWSLQPLPDDCQLMPASYAQKQEIPAYLRCLENIPFVPLPDKNDNLGSRFKTILRQSANKSYFQQQLALLDLLLEIPSAAGDLAHLPQPAMTESSAKNDLVNRCIRYVDVHYPEKINSASLVGELHLSYGHISRIFREVMGMTLNEYINLVRLRKAQYYLRSSKDSLRQIAARTGFRHENYMASMFKERFGLTPTEYRKSHDRFDE